MAASDDADEKYPHLAEWVFGGGWVQIGADENSRTFVRAMDEGGAAFEGADDYPTLEAALQALEAGLAAWMEENG